MSAVQFHPSVTSEDDGRLVITLSGEIDMANAPVLAELVDASVAGGQANLVVDLGDVSFIDSSGLTALVVALAAASNAGGSLALRGATRPTMDLLRLTGLDTIFTLEP